MIILQSLLIGFDQMQCVIIDSLVPRPVHGESRYRLLLQWKFYLCYGLVLNNEQIAQMSFLICADGNGVACKSRTNFSDASQSAEIFSAA